VDRSATRLTLVLRRIPVWALMMWLGSTGLLAATDLKITDSRGTEVVVLNASIDYGGFLGSEKEAQGIRVLQGDGVVFLKWTDVETIKVVRRDESVKPARVELEVTLRNGKKLPAALFRQGQMKLLGKTDLGDYSIDVDKVRTIAPVK
jgi:hypothetical protein